MRLETILVWCENLNELYKECCLVDGDNVLCVDADGIVRRLEWDEEREVLVNTKGVMFEPEEFVEFSLGETRGRL